MEFRLLGPLEVHDGVGPVSIEAPKQRALLALLLLGRGAALPVDRLVDGLWGERAPPTASKAVRVYVGQLRKALGGDAIVTRGAAYALPLEQHALDIERFEQSAADAERLLEHGEPKQGLAAAESALCLWRGPALQDFAYEEFAQGEIARLEERRLSVLETRAEAWLELGRHEQLIAELPPLVREHPFRERLRGQLMLALYRSGRQAEALELYRDGHRLLADELGLEPSPELQRLHQAMLTQDETLATPSRLRRRAGRRRRGGALLAVGGALAIAGAVAAVVVELSGSKPGIASTVPGNAVAVVDPSSARVVAEVPVGATPGAIAVGARSAWVANTSEGTVSRIDLRGRRTTQTIAVGAAPSGIVFAAGAVWVTNSLDGTVSRIDPAADRVVQTISVGSYPSGIAAGAGSIWVANSQDGTVSRLDDREGRAVATIALDAKPTGVAFGAGSLWVTSQAADAVLLVDPDRNEAVQRIHVGSGPTGVSVAGRDVWVANSLDGTVSRIDGRRTAVTATIGVGDRPVAVAATPASAWVANELGGTLARIDARGNRVVRRIEVGQGPAAIALASGVPWVAVKGAGPRHGGGILRVLAPRGVADPFTTVDTLNGYGSPPELWSITRDGLVTFARVGGIGGTQLVPDLATSIPTPTDGGRTYSFTLRSGVRYSNGTLVRPGDVRYAIERQFRARSFGADFYGAIVGAAACRRHPASCDLAQGIAVDRSGRITFRLTAPDPEFLDKLALQFATVVPQGTATTPRPRHPLPATGPYQVSRFVPGRDLRLTRNPYFREWSRTAQPRGYPDEISIRLDGDASAATTAVEQGRADLLLDGPPRERRREVETRFASELRVKALPNTDFIVLNSSRAPFDDIRVRRAVNLAVDRRAAVAVAGGAGAARPACQLLPPGFPGFVRYCPYERDVTSARRLVAASRTAGERVTLFSVAAKPWGAPMARYLVRVLRTLGYRAGLRIVPSYGRAALHAQATAGSWVADYPAASNFIVPFMMCGAVGTAHFCDHGLDRRIRHALALQADDPGSAAAEWVAVDHRLVDRAALVPMVNEIASDLVARRVGGYQYHPQFGALIDQLWLR
jgi:YVTN family beta-propeller protein